MVNDCTNTVEPVLKDRPIAHTNVVSQDRWSCVTGSVRLRCGNFCQKYLVFQDRWSHGGSGVRTVFTYIHHMIWCHLQVHLLTAEIGDLLNCAAAPKASCCWHCLCPSTVPGPSSHMQGSLNITKQKFLYIQTY